MLRTFLGNIRKQRVIGSQVAIAQLGGNWNADGASIQKTFKFGDFRESANFIQRYTEHCQRMGQAPQWSNVYDTVNVTVASPDGDVTTKEVETAKYLDMVSSVRVTNHVSINNNHSFE